MTARQVFEVFVKKHQVKPFFKIAYLLRNPLDYSEYGKLCKIGIHSKDYLKRKSFDEFFTQALNQYGFQSLFTYMGVMDYFKLRNDDRVKKAFIAWRRFVRTKIYVLEDTLKVGDEVECSYGGIYGIMIKGKVVQIDVQRCVVIVETLNYTPSLKRYHNNETYTINIFFNEIKKINGNEPNIQYGIKCSKRKRDIKSSYLFR